MTLEKEGNPISNHEHEWEYDDVVICTNPPMRHKICKLCGRMEHESEAYVEPSKFGDFYEKFYG